MSRGLADTSVFIARESGRPLDVEALPDELAVSIITIGELRAGVLAAESVETRDRRLTTLTAALRLEPVPIDDDVATAWADEAIEATAAGIVSHPAVTAAVLGGSAVRCSRCRRRHRRTAPWVS